MSALLDWMSASVADVIAAPPPVLRADMPARSARGMMREAGSAAVLVTDAAGHAIGLIEPADLLARGAEDRTARDVAQDAASLCEADEKLWRVAARMREEGRAVLGVMRAGLPLGLLPAIAAQAPMAAPLGAMARVGTDDPNWRLDLARDLLADGQDPAAIQYALAETDDEAMRAVAETVLETMQQDGWGAAPVPFALILMGSAGRREGFLHPDQDNGLVIDPYPDEAHAAHDPWFIAFSERLTHGLAAAGYPLCPGHVMATNPLWRKTLDQWVTQIEGWAFRRSGQAMLNADIFFDFRPIWGTADLASRLRAAVTHIVAGDPGFAGRIAWQEMHDRQPLNMLGHILPDGREGGVPVLDLKLHGSLPLVGLVRAMALRHGVAETGTVDRLAALRQSHHLSETLHAELTEDYALLARLRLQAQLEDYAAGRPVTNRLRLDRLTERERGRLVQLFRTLELLRRVTAQSFGGDRA